MSDPRNVSHDKKVIHEKQKHGEHLAEGAAHVPQPGKKTARHSPFALESSFFSSGLGFSVFDFSSV